MRLASGLADRLKRQWAQRELRRVFAEQDEGKFGATELQDFAALQRRRLADGRGGARQHRGEVERRTRNQAFALDGVERGAAQAGVVVLRELAVGQVVSAARLAPVLERSTAPGPAPPAQRTGRSRPAGAGLARVRVQKA